MTIKYSLITALSALGAAFSAFAQDAAPESKVLAFELKKADAEEQIYLIIEGEFLRGTQGSSAESGSAYGKLFGQIREDGVLHVTYNYVIENQIGSKEELFKIAGDKLTVAVGELETHGPNQMVLKDPKKVKFSKVFKQVPLTIPEPDSAESKAVTKVLQGPLAKEAGVPVTLNGIVRIAGNWAFFEGMVTPEEGKTPKDEAVATKLAEREFQAFLKKDDKGGWKVLRSTFAGPAGYFEYEDESETAPWQLTENPDEN